MDNDLIFKMCSVCRNFFYSGSPKTQTFIIKGGELVTDVSDILQEGQYFRIFQSVFNDGIHQFPESNMTDETFTGDITPMAIPKAFLSLAQDISDWIDENGKTADSTFTSESFSGHSNYSYSKGGNSTLSAASDNSWQSYFAKRLNIWRKI